MIPGQMVILLLCNFGPSGLPQDCLVQMIQGRGSLKGPGSPAPSPAVGGLRVWSRCFWPVSHCDLRGRLTPPCSPTADKGPWAQAHFGPRVECSQDQRLLSREPGGVWRSLAWGAPPRGPILGQASGRRRVHALGPCCCGPLRWSPVFQQWWP